MRGTCHGRPGREWSLQRISVSIIVLIGSEIRRPGACPGARAIDMGARSPDKQTGTPAR